MSTPRLSPLGELEGRVMDVVWARGSATAREVTEGLERRHARAYTTIMTTLDRLHRKGLLRRRRDGLAWRYQAIMARARFEQLLADQLAAEMLAAHGDVALAAFVDAAASQDGALLDRLGALVAQRRKARP